MTPSIDQALHQFANLLPNWTLLPILTLLPNFGGFHRTLQRMRLANRGRLLLRTPGPVPFGTCICSYVETILSWTCHVYGPFEFRTSLGTSILLLKFTPWLLCELRSYGQEIDRYDWKPCLPLMSISLAGNFGALPILALLRSRVLFVYFSWRENLFLLQEIPYW